MRYKNDNDNRYRVNFMVATEELMDRLTVAEFIIYLQENGKFEDEDTMYLDGKLVDAKVYELRETPTLRKEFIITEDGRVFYWRTLMDKIELVDCEVEIKVVKEDEEIVSTLTEKTVKDHLDQVAQVYFLDPTVQRLEFPKIVLFENEYYQKVLVSLQRAPQEEIKKYDLYYNIRMEYLVNYKEPLPNGERTVASSCGFKVV